MKREWGLWVKLKGNETGLGWNPIKKTIQQASDDWWDAKIQENPDVAKFREECPKHLNEMEFLFEDVVPTGVGAWAPSQDIDDSYTNEARNTCTHMERYNDKDNYEDNDDERRYEEVLDDELNDESTPHSARKQKRRKVGKGDNLSTFNLTVTYN